jgi:hypothetical protein
MLPSGTNLFEELRELSILTSTLGPLSRPEIAGAFNDSSQTLTAQFYVALRSSSSGSEVEVLKQIAENNPRIKKAAISKLKSRLKAAMLNSLFFLDLERQQYSDYARKLYSIKRTLFMVSVLDTLNARQLCLALAKEGLAEARSIEEWHTALRFLMVLRTTASQFGDARAHNVYAREFEYCQKLFAAEQDATLCLETLQLAFATTRSEKPELARLAEESVDRVNSIARDYPSFTLTYTALRLRTIAAQIRMDYRGTITICTEALALLDKYPLFSNNARRAEYSIQLLFAAIQTRQIHVAKDAVSVCAQYLRAGENNWFVFKECHFLLLMHSFHFQDASDLIHEVQNEQRFFTLPNVSKEKWALYELYVLFALRRTMPIDSIKDFNTALPTYTADKLGLNTALIVLHILLLADRSLFRELLDRSEFIHGYKKRFLKGSNHTHAFLFFGMIGSLQTCDLNYKKIRRQTSKAYIELQRIEREEAIQGEVILPYSWIWERIMDRLREYVPLAHTSGRR